MTGYRWDPPCTVRVHRWENAAVVAVRGAMDLAIAQAFRAVLHDLLDEVSLLLVDLTAVTLLDAHSAGVLVATRRRAEVTGAAFGLRGADGRTRRTLEITGVLRSCERPELGPPAGEGRDRTVEHLLQARDRAGDEETRERLRQLAIAEMFDLAVAMAGAYRGRGEAFDDLAQVALLALIKAIDGYDGSRGPGFTAYAVPTIGGELKRHFRDRGWMIRVPRRMQEIGLRLAHARETLAQQLGRLPRTYEVAAHLGIDVQEVWAAVEAARGYRPRSLSMSVAGDRDGPVLADAIGHPDAGYDLVDHRESLRGLITELPERQQRILALRFFDNLTQAQIAEQTGVSQMHVSRLLADALRHLRTGLLA